MLFLGTLDNFFYDKIMLKLTYELKAKKVEISLFHNIFNEFDKFSSRIQQSFLEILKVYLLILISVSTFIYH